MKQLNLTVFHFQLAENYWQINVYSSLMSDVMDNLEITQNLNLQQHLQYNVIIYIWHCIYYR